MVDRKDVGSWLEGPDAVRTDLDDYPGQRLGMPERGPGSLASVWRRVLAVFVDWFACTVIAAGLMHYRVGEGGAGPFRPLAVFILVNVLLVGTLGSTMGHRLLGIRVVRLDGTSAGPLLAVIRTILLAVVIPAVVWDRDTRGFHDRIAGTVPVRI